MALTKLTSIEDNSRFDGIKSIPSSCFKIASLELISSSLIERSINVDKVTGILSGS